jgi:hypothetical protein
MLELEKLVEEKFGVQGRTGTLGLAVPNDWLGVQAEGKGRKILVTSRAAIVNWRVPVRYPNPFDSRANALDDFVLGAQICLVSNALGVLHVVVLE